MDRLIGELLNNKYKIERQLGQGGMGAVYLGQHIKLNKLVAIKVLLADAVKDHQSLERFKREAEATARIKHPNIITVNDFGEIEDGSVYMVMEYVQGYSLRSLLEREIKLTAKQAIKFACQICAAISAAHNEDIIHRDLKPDNIMIEIVDGFEMVRVLDFGIAKLKNIDQQQLTAVGAAIGTATYMSPEQCSGADVDARADIYSLGVILYQLLSGQLPFQSSNRLAIMVQQLVKPPRPLDQLCPELPAELVAAVMQALEKDPTRRQQSANELSEQLKAAINSTSINNSIYGSLIQSPKKLNGDQNNRDQNHSKQNSLSLADQQALTDQQEGAILDDKYRLIRLLGQGGMGAVYLGQHIKLNKLVAIKVLLADAVKDPQSLERFKREAEATARIKHPNIITVNDFGETEDNSVYMVMEYVQGYSLRKLFECNRQLSPKRVITFARQICAAISAAHNENIIHRDLKPDNIMIEIVDGFEMVRVLDFGIAKLKNIDQQQLTAVGAAIGTATYMSPEQCSGADVDARADIYSLGVILYQLLSGRLPFQSADRLAIMVQQLMTPPQPLDQLCPELPAELVAAVMQALEKDPAHRQQSANELAEQLKAVFSSLPSNSNSSTQKFDNRDLITKGKLDLNKRFTLKRNLGAGAFGSVYEAYDNDRGTVVALKMLRHADAEQIYLFKREFRSLTDIIHTNLVTLYELMSDGEDWFFTMQLVEGVNLLKWIKADSARADIERLRSTFKQLVAGISYLHGAGKLHRDIKPSNVLITAEGRAVILDFGLVMESAAQENIDQIAGTPAYMSPEQAAGLAVSAASDWYSVGVMLYEALTGKLPIVGDTALELMINKQNIDPLPPRTHFSDIPEDLDLLCQDLLKRDEQARPIGIEILARLDQNLINSSTTGIIAAPTPLFIGRDNQLKALADIHQEVKSGKGGIAYVKGYSGMGKSALVRYFLDEILIAQPDTVILMGRCYEQETVPYKALDSIIDSLTRYLKLLPSTEVEEIMPLNVLALARLFPVIKQVEAVLSVGQVLEIPDPQELRQKAFAAFRELITNLASKRKLIIFIDDYQWSDFDSTSLLYELIRPPDTPSILLICSYRAEEVETNEVLKQLSSFQTFVGAKLATTNIVVKELSVEEAETLTFSLLGQHSVDAEIVKRIIKESGGNPFFLYELAQYYQAQLNSLPNLLANSGAISIEVVLKTRIAQLSDRERSLLEVVAVAGQPLERNIAKMAAPSGLDEQMLAILRTGRFVRILKYGDKEELDTYHDRIRETAIKILPQSALTQHHTKLATALESSPNSDPERLFYHFKEAGDKQKAAKYVLIAGSHADQALAFDRASQHYKAAIAMKSASDKDLQEIYIKLAQAQVNAGRGAEAANSYLLAADIAEDITDKEDALELKRRAAEQLLMSGHIDEGVAILKGLLAAVGIPWPAGSRRTIVPLLFNRFWIWLKGTDFHKSNEHEIPKNVLFQIDICASLAFGLAQSDPVRGAYFNTKHLLLALKAGDPYRIMRAINLEVGFTSILKDARKYTNRLFEREKEISAQLNHPYASGWVNLSEGYIAFQQGQWKFAHLSLEKAAEIFREKCTGVAWELDTTKYFSLCALQFMGNYNEVYHRLPSLLSEAKERSDLYLLILSRARYSSIKYLLDDEPEKAIDEIDQAMAQWSQGGFHHQHYVGFSAKVMSYLYINQGQNSKAQELLNQQWANLKRSLLLNVQIINIESRQLRANCALAAAVGNANTNSLLNEAEQDANKIERENLPYANAIALMIRAGVAASRRRVPEAIKFFRLAEEGFNNTNMALHAAIARRRRGELIGGVEGERLIVDADNWMLAQQIKKPSAIAAVFAPGNWQS